MKDEIKMITCPKCGFENVYGTKKCLKCKYEFDKSKKSCPKCAKRNPSNVAKCVSCGYRFDRKERSIWVNLALSLLLVVILCICVYFGLGKFVKGINYGFKAIAAIAVCIVVVTTISYGKNDILPLDAEEEMTKGKFSKLKIISLVLGIIVVLFLIGFGLFMYFHK